MKDPQRGHWGHLPQPQTLLKETTLKDLIVHIPLNFHIPELNLCNLINKVNTTVIFTGSTDAANKEKTPEKHESQKL